MMKPMQVYRIPFSTNCERIALALAHKGLDVGWVDVPADDRSSVEAVSGQPLVPVLVDGDDVIADSPAILRHLERRFPEPRLYPVGPARNAEAEIFVAWFNGVWKRPPNQIADELGRERPDRVAIAEWGAQLTGSLPLFEALLDGRDYLLGDHFGIADVTAFPFLKYATLWQEGDPDLFHRVLRDHLAVGGHERLAGWIDRVDALPRA